eukprot:403356014
MSLLSELSMFIDENDSLSDCDFEQQDHKFELVNHLGTLKKAIKVLYGVKARKTITSLFGATYTSGLFLGGISLAIVLCGCHDQQLYSLKQASFALYTVVPSVSSFIRGGLVPRLSSTLCHQVFIGVVETIQGC